MSAFTPPAMLGRQTLKVKVYLQPLPEREAKQAVEYYYRKLIGNIDPQWIGEVKICVMYDTHLEPFKSSQTTYAPVGYGRWKSTTTIRSGYQEVATKTCKSWELERK
jgi:hypothetical protein